MTFSLDVSIVTRVTQLVCLEAAPALGGGHRPWPLTWRRPVGVISTVLTAWEVHTPCPWFSQYKTDDQDYPKAWEFIQGGILAP